MLDTERDFFNTIQPQLLLNCPGQHVVIKGQDLIGNYNSIQEALSEGAKRFGLDSFLVRRVDMRTETVSIPALSLGVLSANTSHTISSPGDSGGREKG